ncbi:MAG: hypothetical protein AB9835_07990 [Eubacteriales bacterium]
MKSLLSKVMLFSCVTLILLVMSGISVCAANPVPSGEYIKYTTVIKKAADDNLSFAFTRIKTSDYVIQPGDKLEYDVLLGTSTHGYGFIDGQVKGVGPAIRDIPGIQDQNGINAHATNDLSDYAGQVWFHRELSIAVSEEDASDPALATVGKVFTEFQLSMHPGDDTGYTDQTVEVYYDNIVITNNGQEKLVVFRSASDIDLSKVSTSNKKNTTATVEILTMTADEEKAVQDAIAAKEEEARKAEEERERKKQEASEKAEEERKQRESESLEQARLDAERQSSEQAYIQASEEAADSAAKQQQLIIIIAACVGGAVIVVLIIVFAVSRSKKKQEKK